MADKSERLLLGVDKVADLLGLTRPTIYARIKDGTLPSVRIGKRILVPKAALDRLLAGAS